MYSGTALDYTKKWVSNELHQRALPLGWKMIVEYDSTCASQELSIKRVLWIFSSETPLSNILIDTILFQNWLEEKLEVEKSPQIKFSDHSKSL